MEREKNTATATAMRTQNGIENRTEQRKENPTEWKQIVKQTMMYARERYNTQNTGTSTICSSIFIDSNKLIVYYSIFFFLFNSIPVDFHRINKCRPTLIVTSMNQRAGFYFLFDKSAIDEWLKWNGCYLERLRLMYRIVSMKFSGSMCTSNKARGVRARDRAFNCFVICVCVLTFWLLCTFRCCGCCFFSRFIHNILMKCHVNFRFISQP